ncbi:hypothetical protein D3C81_1734550 [compost metagenome]
MPPAPIDTVLVPALPVIVAAVPPTACNLPSTFSVVLSPSATVGVFNVPSTSRVPALSAVPPEKVLVPTRVATPTLSLVRNSKLVVWRPSSVIAATLFNTTVSPAPFAPPSMTLFSTAPSLRVNVSSPPHRSMAPLPLTVPDTLIVSLPAPQP